MSKAGVQLKDNKSAKLGPRKPVPVPPDAKWISTKQLLARYGNRSAMWAWRKIENDPDFPKPTYFGRNQMHSVALLDAYDELIIARSNAREEKPRSVPPRWRRGRYD
jgi:hypothetical protein